MTLRIADDRMCPTMLLRILGSALANLRPAVLFFRLAPHSRDASRLSWRLVWAASSLLVIVCVAACSNPDERKAPDFKVSQFDGSQFSLSDQAGQNAVVVNFWYPTCPPCREEMPAFEEAWQEVRHDKVRFLGIFVPQGFDTEQDARDFVNEVGLTYDFATDSRARIAQSFELAVFPTTFFIDKSGRIIKSRISILDDEEIVRIVRQMTEG